MGTPVLPDNSEKSKNLMEIVICLLKEAINQYQSGDVYVGDKCLVLVLMIRDGRLSIPDPQAEFVKPEQR